LWYGFKNTTFLNKIKWNKKKQNNVTRRYLYSLKYKTQLNKQNFRLLKPFKWDLTILLNLKSNYKSLYLNSLIYIVTIPLPIKLTNISFDINTNILKLSTLYTDVHYRLYWVFLKRFLSAFYSPLFLKLKFKGKGYYIYKNKRNTITPQFGYAHRLYLYSYFVSVKFLSKTSIIVFGFNWNDLITTGLNLKKMRPINIFTGRGVRFSRQIIYKKTGKVSTYR